MAWSSSNSSFPFTTNPRENHDVFLSFRGDTRYNFASHLHAALTRLKIKTYIDYNLERGDEISSTLLRAIEKSRVAVIIFSKNYASSRWCLDELVKIIECKRTRRQIVVPVFYDIYPSDVRHQTGTYADAFAQHERRYSANIQKVQRWRSALIEAANLSGWDCFVNRKESQLVEEIAIDVLQKLDRVQNGDIENRIAGQQHAAQLQLHRAIRTQNSSDVEDLIATNQNILHMKTERFLRMAGLLR